MRKAWLVAPVVVLLVAGSGAAAWELRPTRTASRVASPSPSPVPVRTPLLTPAPPGAEPTTALLAKALMPLLKNPALGPRVELSVIDVPTGHSLLDVGSTGPVAPASTAKLVTAIAALKVLGPTRTFTTTVVQGRPGDVVLVGAGDPTLAGPYAGTHVPPSARLADLARQLTGTVVKRVLVDDTLFTGARMGPGWKPSYVDSGNVTPVSALEVDEGRTGLKEHAARSFDSALDAGRQLAKLLGVKVVARGKAVVGAKGLAQVTSPPVADLVERMLTDSDNDLAEALGRQVALALHRPATFAGEVAALSSIVPQAAGMRDASGLSPLDRVRPGDLTRLLVTIASDVAFAPVRSGLPVAGFDGTLEDRFRKAPESVAAGQVRAKTGTLDGVSALAGLIRTSGGRLLAFDVTAAAVPLGATLESQAALDRVAAAIATCRCA